MARARNIKPGFFRNADLAELPVETRLLFIGLWTMADREGRLEDRPKQIKMELFPADSFNIGSMLDQLQSSGFVNRYEVDTKKFIEIENFIKHQDPHYKEKASEIPPPPGKENFMRAYAVTKTQRMRILERDNHRCKLCNSEDALCIDHVYPVSRGGDSSDDNLQVLCMACNTKKGNKIDVETKNSVQRRFNVGSMLNQRNDASPSDSLIPDSLIPDSLIPDSLIPEEKHIVPGKPVDACPHQDIISLYHEHLPSMPNIKIWTDKRKKILQSRWREDEKRQSLEWWGKYFRYVATSDFLCGRTKEPFNCDLEWLINPSNMVKIIEGKYDNR